jgi:hypothetical protein
MQEPTHIRKGLVLGGVAFSFVGLCWLLSLSYHPPEYLLRFGFISAVLSMIGAFSYSWAVTVAYLARRWSWAPRTCGLAGLVFLIPAAYFLISNSLHFMGICAILLGPSSLTGYLCRHLAYPQLSDDEFAAQPPPSLFPK